MTRHSPEQHTPSESYIHHIKELAIKEVRDTKEYAELRGRGTSTPDAFRTIAHSVAENSENNLSTADRALLTIVADLGVFAEASREVEDIYRDAGDYPLSDSELSLTRHLKREYLIPFNHNLKEFINTHPNDEIRTVSSAFANAYQLIFSRYEALPPQERSHHDALTPQEVFMAIQGCLDGMRHEIAAEAMLDAMGYSYDYEVSTAEDAAGSDLFVYLGDEFDWVGIDIKASQHAVESARQHHRFSRAVATGLDWGDFTGQKGTAHGALSIPYATAEARGDAFIQSVYETARYNKQQRLRASRQAGNRSVQYAGHR